MESASKPTCPRRPAAEDGDSDYSEIDAPDIHTDDASSAINIPLRSSMTETTPSALENAFLRAFGPAPPLPPPRIGKHEFFKEWPAALHSRVSSSIKYTNNHVYSQRPSIALAVTALDCETWKGSNELRFWITASDINRSGFTANSFYNPQYTENFLINVSWLEILPCHEQYIQHGEAIFDAEGPLTFFDNQEITFDTPFPTPPKVVVWITGLHATKSEDRFTIELSPSQPSNTSFKLSVLPCNGTKIYAAKVTWVAHNPSIPSLKICSGSASSADVRGTSAEDAQVHDRGYASFSDPELFTGSPTTMLGINKLDFRGDRNVRVNAWLGLVNRLGVFWCADSWADSVMFDVGVDYLAFERG